MSQSIDAAKPATGEAGIDHGGSACPTLTGRTVLLVWCLSVALHVGGLAVMFLLVFSSAAPADNDLPLAHIDIIGQIDADPSPSIRPSDQPSRTGTQNPLDEKLKPNPADRLAELSTNAKPDLSIIGIGAGAGDFSKYGFSAGKGAGPQFFGLGGSARGARRIVYVVDRSGSMLDTFVHVREEMKRSINALRRSQKFHIILFNSGEPLENPPKRLVSAIKAQKKAAFKFLESVFPEGSTRPQRAMRRALNTDPDLIYFLTDGGFDPALVDKLDRWNKGRRVRIFTIAFFDRSGAELLERIAREHGGEFKFVSENTLP